MIPDRLETSKTILRSSAAIAAARAFYCEALRGQQVRSARSEDAGLSCFRVARQVITTGPGIGCAPVTVVVDDPAALAERCWDAGFDVHVRGSADATTISVVDPFGLELELVETDQHRPRRCA